MVDYTFLMILSAEDFHICASFGVPTGYNFVQIKKVSVKQFMFLDFYFLLHTNKRDLCYIYSLQPKHSYTFWITVLLGCTDIIWHNTMCTPLQENIKSAPHYVVEPYNIMFHKGFQVAIR